MAMELLIVLGVLVLVALVVIGIYNGLVAKRQACNQGWADIDAGLRQRNDLIPNLVETVKGYAAHESSVLTAVIAARAGVVDAKSPEALARAERTLSGALGNLLAVAENYPDLKASANFQALQGELADVEDKLAAARRAYNGATAAYNAARESFPAVLFASGLGFAPRAFWELDVDDRKAMDIAPAVKFGA
jgi:LemA protein